MPLAPVFLPAQISLWDLVKDAGPLPIAVMVVLVLISLLSWTIIFSKWSALRTATSRNRGFLRAFRQSESLQPIAAAIQTIPMSPLVAVFEFGYEEVDRQVRRRGGLSNQIAIERALQLGVSEEMTKLERNMNWLATTASISPFVGLFGTVWGIIDAFTGLGAAGSASLRAVAPGIAEALIATALGLGAAIPAAVAYNYFTHQLREMGSRMDDFSLEFINLAERSLPD
ncbi:MAG: MotA/TolQ/ExbB proton channel family protein [Bryobacteraceae bacterium]